MWRGYTPHPRAVNLPWPRQRGPNVASAREALASVTGAALEETWSLRRGEQVLYSAPVGEAVRGHLNRLIHHRGQLTVYVRLVDVPLPQIYGPTDDERW